MTLFGGPRHERRRIFHNGSTYWCTVSDDGSLLLDDGRRLDGNEVAYLPPCNPTKIICVHLNYRSRAIESRNSLTAVPYPTYFMKPISSLNGHRGEVVRPADCQFLNYEGEVAAIIGKVTFNVTREEAWECIAGFAPALDMGLHDFRDTDAGSMLRVKGRDGFCPIGPGLVSGVDIREQTIRTYRNGLIVQEARIGEEMIWDPDFLVADLSRHMTLMPGDVIMTGTPCHSRPLEPGDVVEVEITCVGRLTNHVVEGPVPSSGDGFPPSDTAEARRVAFGVDDRVPQYLKDNYRAASR